MVIVVMVAVIRSIGLVVVAVVIVSPAKINHIRIINHIFGTLI